MTARTIHLANFWLLSIYLVAVAIVWPRLPERIPIHFGLDGTADAWTRTSFLSWFGIPLMAVAMALLLLGTIKLARRSPNLWNIPEKRRFLLLSPEQRAPIEMRLERVIAIAGILTTTLFMAIHVGMYQAAMGLSTGLSRASMAIAFGSTTAIVVVALFETAAVGREIREAGTESPISDARSRAEGR